MRRSTSSSSSRRNPAFWLMLSGSVLSTRKTMCAVGPLFGQSVTRSSPGSRVRYHQMPPPSAVQKTASAAMPIAMLRACRFFAALLLRAMRGGAIGVQREHVSGPGPAVDRLQALGVCVECGFDARVDAIGLAHELRDETLL